MDKDGNGCLIVLAIAVVMLFAPFVIAMWRWALS